MVQAVLESRPAGGLVIKKKPTRMKTTFDNHEPPARRLHSARGRSRATDRSVRTAHPTSNRRPSPGVFSPPLVRRNPKGVRRNPKAKSFLKT